MRRTSGSLRSRGWRQKGWGQGSNQRLPIGTPSVLSNLLSYSVMPVDISREKRGVIGQHSSCQSTSGVGVGDKLPVLPFLSAYSLQLLHPPQAATLLPLGALVSLLLFHNIFCPQVLAHNKLHLLSNFKYAAILKCLF